MPMPLPPKTPRERLHHALRHNFSAAIAAYYVKYPERLTDPFLEQGIDALQKLMLDVLASVDQFEISDLQDRRKTVRPPDQT